MFCVDLRRVLATMRSVDQSSWGLLSGNGVPAGGNIRVFEYHEYTEGGEVCDPTHSVSPFPCAA